VRNLYCHYERFRRVLRTVALLSCVALVSACHQNDASTETSRVPGGDPERGRLLAQQYQCAACHFIPNVQGANGDAGPSLEHMGRLSYIAGGIPNQPDNMMRFLKNPPAVKPGTLMPALGISDEEARHMAAYMYTLR